MPTLLVTGANRGLGLGHVAVAAARGWRVFALARNPAAAEDLHRIADGADGRVTVIGYDGDDPDAPGRVAQAIGEAPIDILLLNAGVLGLAEGAGERLDGFDPAAFLETLRINVAAPLALAVALIPAVAASERRLIALQSSELGSTSRNASGGFLAYRASKAGMNSVCVSLARDLAPRGITVVSLHPGWVRTRMGGEAAPLEIEDAVADQHALLDRLGPADTGGFFDRTGRTLPW